MKTLKEKGSVCSLAVLQKSLFVLVLSLQNAGQADDDDEVSYVSNA